MNKEEFIDILKEFDIKTIEGFNISYRDNEDKPVNISQGSQCVIDLYQIVQEAIHTIEDVIIPFGDSWYWDNATLRDYMYDLLNILKGSEE